MRASADGAEGKVGGGHADDGPDEGDLPPRPSVNGSINNSVGAHPGPGHHLRAKVLLLSSYSLAAWAWRSWEFTVALVLIELYPGSLLVVSAYGLLVSHGWQEREGRDTGIAAAGHLPCVTAQSHVALHALHTTVGGLAGRLRAACPGPWP